MWDQRRIQVNKERGEKLSRDRRTRILLALSDVILFGLKVICSRYPLGRDPFDRA